MTDHSILRKDYCSMTHSPSTSTGGFYFPPELLQAVLVPFEPAVDGYLLAVRKYQGGYRAAIYFDASEKYGNGDVINVGIFVSTAVEHGYTLAVSACGGRYVLVNNLMRLADDRETGSSPAQKLRHS